MTSPPDRDAVLARGDEQWTRLRAALDARLREPLGPDTDWTGHDVYAHFARWQQKTIDAMRKLAAGERPDEAEDHEDVLNMRWRAEDRALPTETVRERCLASRAKLRAMLVALPEAQWAAYGSICAEDIDGRHYAHHLAVCAPELVS
jgi:hypothetical protein